nr:hypothetical protein [Pseudomonas shirazica]
MTGFDQLFGGDGNDTLDGGEATISSTAVPAMTCSMVGSVQMR